MPVTDDQVAAVVAALTRDMKARRLDRHLGIIAAEAANAREFVEDPQDYVEKVVEDVQQDILDLSIDTTWPRCPRHFRHPLWFHDGAWVCEQDQVAIARLGELPAPPSDEKPWQLFPSS